MHVCVRVSGTCLCMCACTCVSLCTQTCLVRACLCIYMCLHVHMCFVSPSFLSRTKAQGVKALPRSLGERGVEMQISDKCYLRCHLVSPRRESKWRTVPNPVKDKSASSELRGLCGVRPQPPGAGPAATLPVLAWRLHGVASSKEVPAPRNNDPAGDALGLQLGPGGLLYPQHYSFRNQGSKNSTKDCSPEKRGGCQLREAATGGLWSRKHWACSKQPGEKPPTLLPSPPLLLPALDFHGGALAHVHTHVHTRMHPVCAHGNVCSTHVHMDAHANSPTHPHTAICLVESPHATASQAGPTASLLLHRPQKDSCGDWLTSI